MKKALVCFGVIVAFLLQGANSIGNPPQFSDQWNGTGICGEDFFSLAASPDYVNDKTIFAGGYGVFKTTDGGLNWQALDFPADFRTICVLISPDYVANKTVFAGTEGRGLFVSKDDGSHWEQIQAIPSRWIGALTAASADNIIVGTQDSGIFRSIDGGLTWGPVVGIPNRHILSLLAADASTIFAGTANYAFPPSGGLFKSTDAGANWSPINNPEWYQGYPMEWTNLLAASPNYTSDQTVYAAGFEGYASIWRSTNGGQRWQRLHDPWVTPLGITCLKLSKDGTTLFFGVDGDIGNNGLYMTNDVGMNWTHMGMSIPQFDLHGVESLALTSDNNIYIGSWTGIWTTAPISFPPSVPPSSRITSPIDRAAIRGETFTITGTATVNCPYYVDKVEISINGGDWSLADGLGNDWSYPWTLPTDGSCTIRSRVTDNRGNQETPSSGITVKVDNTNPISAVRNTTWNTVDGSRYLVITGAASDRLGSGVAKVRVGFTGIDPRNRPFPVLNNRIIWADARGTINWTYKIKIPPNSALKRGTRFVVKSQAIDRAGNIEIPADGTVVIIP